MESHEKRLRKIEADLELVPVITSFADWKSLRDRDKQILYALHKYGLEGASTLELAKDINLSKPETSGRTIVLRRLLRIQKISIRLKSFALVLKVGKKWALNFDDFAFNLKEEKRNEV